MGWEKGPSNQDIDTALATAVRLNFKKNSLSPSPPTDRSDAMQPEHVRPPSFARSQRDSINTFDNEEEVVRVKMCSSIQTLQCPIQPFMSEDKKKSKGRPFINSLPPRRQIFSAKL